MENEHFQIRIVDYDPLWPHSFQREAARIRAALGDRALRIEHTGSTSVPGLAAKPVIDILLVVVDSASESEYAPALEGSGYRLHIREPGWHEHRMFKGPDTRISESDRELYERTKRELALKHWKNTQSYADAKTQVIESIMTRALRSGSVTLG